MQISNCIRGHFYLRTHIFHMLLHIWLLKCSSHTIFIVKINFIKSGLIWHKPISCYHTCYLFGLKGKWVEINPVHCHCWNGIHKTLKLFLQAECQKDNRLGVKTTRMTFNLQIYWLEVLKEVKWDIKGFIWFTIDLISVTKHYPQKPLSFWVTRWILNYNLLVPIWMSVIFRNNWRNFCCRDYRFRL